MLLIFFSQELVLVYFIVLVLLFGLFYTNKNEYKTSSNFISLVLCLGIFVCFCLLILGFNQPGQSSTLYFLDNNFSFNYLVKMLKAFMLILVILFFCISYKFLLLNKLPVIEFVVLILLILEGMFLVISGNNLFIIFLGIELQSLIFYILVGLKKYSNICIEASFKYFILSSYSNGFFLFGISLIFGSFGTINLSEIVILLDENLSSLFLIGILFIFFGIIFKLALIPFHYWIGDIYEGSPLIITAFFAIITKIQFVYLLYKFYFLFSLYLYPFLLLFSILSIIFGTFISLYQVTFKRLIAFGTITHMGYIGLAIYLNTIEGFAAAFFYLFVYVFLNVSLFCFLLYFMEQKSVNLVTDVNDIVSFSKLIKKNFLLTFIFCVNILSIAGIPPFAGFFSKWYILIALINSGNIFLSCFMILFSILSSVYYIRLVRFLFFNYDNVELQDSTYPIISYNFLLYLIILILFFNVLFIFFHIILFMFIHNIFLLSLI